MEISDNIKIIEDNIANACVSCKRKNDIKIVAVTKTRTAEEINKLLLYGIDTIGENRVQELIEKYDKINDGFDIQVIGQLQTNKVKYVTGKISCIQSLDRVSLAKEIEKQYNRIGSSVDALIQVNLTDDESRGGVPFEQTRGFCEEVSKLHSIRLKGIMAVAPIGLSKPELRKCFAKVYKLYTELRNSFPQMDRLSMGMSNDYVEAILEGATEIRLGSAIFGARNYNL